MNDGDPGTFWLASQSTNQWVALRWEKPIHLSAIQLRGFQGVIQRSSLQVLGADGQSWTELPDTGFSPQFLGSRSADFFFPEAIVTTGVRYFITATHSTENMPGLAEFLVYDSSALQP